MELEVVLVFLAIVLAAFVKGFVGFGFPLISVPMVALIVDPKTAVIAMSIPTMLSNVIVLVRGNVPVPAVRRALPFIVPLVFAAAVGAALLPVLDQRLLGLIIGVVSTLFAVLSLVRLRITLTPAQERVASPLAGVAAGLLGGATTIYGPLVALYFQTLRYDKWPFVYVLSLIFLLGTVAQNVTYATLQLYQADAVLYGLLSCLPVYIGVHLGMHFNRKASLPVFQYLVLVVVLLSSVNLIVRGLRIGG
jgi:uncharacterized membrane protein YfcA